MTLIDDTREQFVSFFTDASSLSSRRLSDYRGKFSRVNERSAQFSNRLRRREIY